MDIWNLECLEVCFSRLWLVNKLLAQVCENQTAFTSSEENQTAFTSEFHLAQKNSSAESV